MSVSHSLKNVDIALRVKKDVLTMEGYDLMYMYIMVIMRDQSAHYESFRHPLQYFMYQQPHVYTCSRDGQHFDNRDNELS